MRQAGCDKWMKQTNGAVVCWEGGITVSVEQESRFHSSPLTDQCQTVVNVLLLLWTTWAAAPSKCTHTPWPSELAGAAGSRCCILSKDSRAHGSQHCLEHVSQNSRRHGGSGLCLQHRAVAICCNCALHLNPICCTAVKLSFISYKISGGSSVCND